MQCKLGGLVTMCHNEVLTLYPSWARRISIYTPFRTNPLSPPVRMDQDLNNQGQSNRTISLSTQLQIMRQASGGIFSSTIFGNTKHIPSLISEWWKNIWNPISTVPLKTRWRYSRRQKIKIPPALYDLTVTIHLVCGICWWTTWSLSQNDHQAICSSPIRKVEIPTLPSP